MPLSFQSFGVAGILIMVGILSIAELVKHLRRRHQHH
ncbi:hypothetical protein EV199_4243 [Pseudobacter ginsenosidimutans]|uniref:Uncharacterized protein n=1 Tax=Pseudobacter ginsenosidimutans TaxID=661488 RepID=A0A4Q7MWA0_9BACT|nr:hypothetical protein EV199_4243 [Pseudobacter ginsenosidimutans]